MAGLSGGVGDVLGAQKRGAHIVFRYFDPFADRVFIIGSFNGWSESIRMEKSRDGIWTAKMSASECPVGSTYKYKAYIGDEVKYITDPYSEMTDGAPYYNSVVCKPDGYVWGDGAFLESNAAVYKNGFNDEPLHIYELTLDGWCSEHIKDDVTYERIARELSVYAKQMRYTHVLLDDVFARYFNMDSGAYSVAYYAPNTRFGNTHGFRRFVDIMHRANIGVMIECNFGGGADIYSRYEMCTAVVLYWMRNYHIDGVALAVNDKRSADLATDIERGVHAMRCDAAVIARGDRAFVKYVNNCIPWISGGSEDFLQYFKRSFQDRTASGLCDSLGVGCEIVTPVEKYCVDELCGDEWRIFAGARALSACVVTMCCKKMMYMGQEIGMEEANSAGGVKWRLTDRYYNARLQLCMSDLGELYLSYPALWQDDNMEMIDESSADIGVVSFERMLGDERLITVVNLSVDVYDCHGITVSRAGVYDEIFNSDSERYGGSGVVNSGAVNTAPYKKGRAMMYVKVPPLAVSVFKLRVK